ncbi:hypothetical protein IAQ61_005130 [Plenodomus lingam]|uniref:uncharacterized protein n=1 Tax=Leptosphaeria maculans TaxID=5022 RepID=UPI00332683B9|nr:hypothetical protein IAQ61_005130 [Plenodomus lingam]
MSDRDAKPLEFGFLTSDHAGAPPRQPQRQQYGSYMTGGSTNVPDHSTVIAQAGVQDPALSYGDFDAQQRVAPPYANFGYNPAAALNWGWNNALEFNDFSNQYEPQGELVQEFQQQPLPSNDFTIPVPVSAEATDYHRFQQLHSATSTLTATPSQNPFTPPLPPQLSQTRPHVQAGVKRKGNSEPDLSAAQNANHLAEGSNKRQHISRNPSDASTASSAVAATPNTRPPHAVRGAATSTTTSTNEPTSRSVQPEETQAEGRKEQSKGTGSRGITSDTAEARKVANSEGVDVLPAGKVFPIQIGSKLFRLSGASLSSDAPSYFSHFFGHQLQENGGRAGDVKTLYIDRDPDTFRDIALHLQGYHVTPKNGEHFVKLYADAQFYSLPQLTKQLFKTDIFVSIGGTPFQVPRDLFSAPGDSPNYFSWGFAQFFSTPAEAFPGLDRSALLRPPSISPPSVPNRNGEVFRELLQLLQGYDLEIRNEEHRSRLLRDARYFHLKGLEQRLILHEISYHLKRQQSEILIRLEDIRQSGISFSTDESSGKSEPDSAHGGPTASAAVSPLSKPKSITGPGFVTYARPFTDDAAQNHTLILETSATEFAKIHFPCTAQDSRQRSGIDLCASFYDSSLARMTSLFTVIASKLGLSANQPFGFAYLRPGGGTASQSASSTRPGSSERRVRVRLDTECAVLLDGAPVEIAMNVESGTMGIRKSGGARLSPEWLWVGRTIHHNNANLRTGEDAEVEWTVKRAQWRVRVEPMESDTDGNQVQVLLCAVKIEASTTERTRNQARGFLGGG